MRKLIVLEHISLDGVVQGPGGPTEDPSNGFRFGGWSAPFDDPAVGDLVAKKLNSEFDLLLGRTTFEIWENYWPTHADIWPPVMTATKFVASTVRTSSPWKPSVFLNGDVGKQVAEIKKQKGPDLHVWGSANLLQTLMKHDLVDVFLLIMYPVTLGSGKRLFGGGTMPASFRVAESVIGPSGVIAATYERAGEVKTGTVGG